MKKEISVAYTKNADHWRVEKERQFTTVDELKNVADEVTDICFVSGHGLGIVYKTNDEYEMSKYRQFEGLTPQLLEDIANAELFGKTSNAKIWYCCLKYSVENKECFAFWNKYKDTSAGPKFMAIVLGEKTQRA